jgi:hypothetical protein
MKTYDTLVEALNDLRKRGYTIDFNLEANCLICKNPRTTLTPEEFDIKEVYRFEGMNDPSDSSILYAIESHNGLKGTLVNAYGVYADEMSDQMVAKLHTPSN